MICATCGKNNADHLMFCEDCGARLAPKRVDPLAVLPPPDPPRVVEESPRPPPLVAPRPSAPDVSFAPRVAARNACPNCGAANPAGMRFCASCGRSLDAKPSSPEASQENITTPSVPMQSPFASTSVLQPAAIQPDLSPIAPSPVVDLGAKPAATEGTRTCWRCRGAVAIGSQFCRFCGAPLQEPPSATHATPAPSPSGKRLDSTLVSGPPAFSTNPGSVAPSTSVLEAVPPTSPQAHVVPAAAVSIVSIAQDGSLGARHSIGERLDIGRAEGDVLVPDDRYLAPRHARITRESGGLRLRDLGTPNGVYVRVRNGLELSLNDQDLILVGQQVLRFEIVKSSDEGFGAASQHGTLLFGTPSATPAFARLLQRTTEGVTRDVFHLSKEETVLGRESGDIVFTSDAFLSRRHAAVRKRGEQFFLSDMGSSNGTFLQIRGSVTLEVGDEFRVGQQLYRVDISDPKSRDERETRPSDSSVHSPTRREHA